MTTKTRLEPPDGGWGIFVCIGMALMFVIGMSGLATFGLVFEEFLKSHGAETSAVTIVTSVCFCSSSLAGLISGQLFNRFGVRRVGLFGAMLYIVGVMWQIFIDSIWELLLCNGLLQAVGIGLMIPCVLTTFNNYFVKNRIMWMSITQCLVGLGSVGFPVLVQRLLDYYGFRGTLLVLAGISMNFLVAILLMQPVKWHMRRVIIEEIEEQKEFMASEKKGSLKTETEEKIETKISTEESKIPPEHEFKKNPHKEDLKIHHLHEMQKHSKYSRDELRARSRRSSSILSLGNWTGPVMDASPEMIISSRSHSIAASSVQNGAATIKGKEEEQKRSIWRTIVDLLDLGLLKSPVFDNIVIGISFVAFSDITFFTLLPLYLSELHFSKSATATILSIAAAADLASRLILAIFAICIKIPPRYIYLYGAIFSTIIRFAFIYVRSFMGVACVIAASGFFRTWLHVPVPLILAEHLPKDRFASGYGIYMFLHGIIIFLLGPFVGYLRDATRDYIIVFKVLMGCLALCLVAWIIEFVAVKFRRKEKISSGV